MNIALFSLIAILLYCLSGFLLAYSLYKRGDIPIGKWGILAFACVALVIHTVNIYHNLYTPAGLDLGFFNAVSLFTWLMSVLLVVASLRKPVENLGIVLFPLAALAIALGLAFAQQSVRLEQVNSELQIHILISVLAYSLLNIAAVQAVLLAIQDQHLRARHPGGFIRALPPLQTMETLLFQMIGLGFVMQSLSLLSGAAFVHNMFAQHLVHKTVLSLAAWGVFGTLLWGRWRFGWRGKKAIRWTLSGFAVMMLGYFGSKLVLELVLHRG